MQKLYCPRCGKQTFHPVEDKAYQCSQCDFLYYHNVAATSSAIIECDNRLLLVIRARDPGAGLLDLPGGFAEPNETLEQALTRELHEELGCHFTATPRYIGSFPNRYLYRDILYNTLDAFFSLQITTLPELHVDDDVAGYQWVTAADIDYERIAFDSIKQALKMYLDKIKP